MSFVFNPGMLSELNVGGSGALAAALAMGAVALILRRRYGWGVALLALAALSREAMLIAAVGSAWWLWRRTETRSAVLALALPVVAVLSWGVYLRARLGWQSGTGQIEEIGVPFVGFVRAFDEWATDPIGLAWGLVVMVLFVLYTRRTLRSGHLVGWAFLGFAVLGILFTRQVWIRYFDITRAVAPLITAYVLMLFAPAPRDEANKSPDLLTTAIGDHST
jgi:hypothetical protein